MFRPVLPGKQPRKQPPAHSQLIPTGRGIFVGGRARLLAAAEHKAAGTENPQLLLSPVNGGVVRDPTPVQTAKRPLDARPEGNPGPAKRARLARLRAQQPMAKEAAHAVTKAQQSKPRPARPRPGATKRPEQVSPATRLRKRQVDSDSNHDQLQRKRQVDSDGNYDQLRWKRQVDSDGNHDQLRWKRQVDSDGNHDQLRRKRQVDSDGNYDQLRWKRQVDSDGNHDQLRWKRQVDSDGNHDQLQRKRARLSQNNLALFNKMARKKASSKASTSAPPDSTVDSSSSKALSTTSSGFAVRAHRNGILDPLQSKAPVNLDDIREQHARSRATASPPESRFKHHARTISKAGNDATTVDVVSRHLLKEYYDDGYQRAFNRAFTAFPKDVGFNDGLAATQPDFVEGLEMREYDPFPVDKHVSGAVLYKGDPYSVILPHLAVEWKGPDESMAKATLHSAYVGAALVYTRNQAMSLVGKPGPLGHAKVTTFTSDGTNVNFYAHYAAPSKEGGKLEYRQYQYASANVKDTYQGHLDGRKGIRNRQDHARDQSYAVRHQSYAVRDQIKKHWKQSHNSLHPAAERAPPVKPNDILNDIPEESLPVQESNSSPEHDDCQGAGPPSVKSPRPKRKSRKAPPTRGTDHGSGCELVDRPSYAIARLSNSRQLSSHNSANTVAKKPKSLRARTQ
ncbi:hypothetical protein DV737_g3789, partial [Chaetothyriales sp. CBS 132003]